MNQAHPASFSPKYHLRWRGTLRGPYSVDEILALLQQGQVSIYHEVVNGTELLTVKDLQEQAATQLQYRHPEAQQTTQQTSQPQAYTSGTTAKPASSHPLYSNVQHTAADARAPMTAPATRENGIPGNRYTDLFSGAFHRHGPDEIEDLFTSGGKATTPALAAIPFGLPRPWIYLRCVGMSILLFTAFAWALFRFKNLMLFSGLMFVGSFALPLSILLFFIEANKPRNITFYKIGFLFMQGSIISLIITCILYEYTKLDTIMGAPAAGIIEEIAKLLTVIICVRKWSLPYLSNALLVGAAVGTGFAAFETAGYIFTSLLEKESIAAGIQNAVLRSALAPFTHIIWTAIAFTGYWRAQMYQPVFPYMLLHFQFLRLFIIPVILHAWWNSPYSNFVFFQPVGQLVGLLVIGLLGWYVIVSLVVESSYEVDILRLQKNQS